jgi:hypothetical protein
VDRDEDVRTACFLALDFLRAQFREELPYKTGLDRGFSFRGGLAVRLERLEDAST